MIVPLAGEKLAALVTRLFKAISMATGSIRTGPMSSLTSSTGSSPLLNNQGVS
ncbi:hypothetical protein D3C76_1587870 [compost metagenome]